MKKHNHAFEALCEAARKNIKEITIAEVKALMDKNKLPLFVDVREESEWHKDHLPYAKYIGRGILERQIEIEVPDLTTPMILYCGGGYRSALAAESLQKMGYTQVESMAGGYRAWCEANYPLVNESDLT